MINVALLRLRYSRKLKMKEVAKACGISVNTLQNAERGKNVNVATLKKLADYYGVGLAAVLPPEQEQ